MVTKPDVSQQHHFNHDWHYTAAAATAAIKCLSCVVHFSHLQVALFILPQGLSCGSSLLVRFSALSLLRQRLEPLTLQPKTQNALPNLTNLQQFPNLRHFALSKPPSKPFATNAIYSIVSTFESAA